MPKQLTQKEQMLLQDNLKHEELCIWKYTTYASRASTPELRNLLNEIAQEEVNHYNTISGFLGQGPYSQSGAGSGSGGQDAHSGGPSGKSGGQKRGIFGMEIGAEAAPIPQHIYDGPGGHPHMSKEMELGAAQGHMGMPLDEGAVPSPGHDKKMLGDLLATEKYISGTYDTAVFECVDPHVRESLQHIQKDEQDHGEKVFNYMHKHGMYQVK